MHYLTTYSSPVGNITLACAGDGLTGLWIEGQKYHGAGMPEGAVSNGGAPIFVATKKWLDKYFAGKKPAISELTLTPSGTEFRKMVWDILCEIPYGEVVTYADIAKKVAARTSRKSIASRAIGGAVGHNPISVIIPCHRVIGSDGSLTGYAGGVDKTIKLLELEGVCMPGAFN